MKTVLKIGGMTCQNCARHVREALQKVPGVKSLDVNLEAGRADVDGEGLDLKALAAAVEREGYTADEAAG